jgi:protease I
MPKRLQGKRVVLLVANEFEDIELWYPALRMSEEGAEVVICAVEIGLHPRPALPQKYVTGRFGTTVPPLVHQVGKRFSIAKVEEINPRNADALIIPGGFSPDALRVNKRCLDVIRGFHNQGKIVAGICHGPQALISAGVVKGRRITSYAAVKDDLVNAGADFVDEAVVVDGNIITSRVPDDLPEFCLSVIEKLAA